MSASQQQWSIVSGAQHVHLHCSLPFQAQSSELGVKMSSKGTCAEKIAVEYMLPPPASALAWDGCVN